MGLLAIGPAMARGRIDRDLAIWREAIVRRRCHRVLVPEVVASNCGLEAATARADLAKGAVANRSALAAAIDRFALATTIGQTARGKAAAASRIGLVTEIDLAGRETTIGRSALATMIDRTDRAKAAAASNGDLATTIAHFVPATMAGPTTVPGMSTIGTSGTTSATITS
jgi:hypothetical protein